MIRKFVATTYILASLTAFAVPFAPMQYVVEKCEETLGLSKTYTDEKVGDSCSTNDVKNIIRESEDVVHTETDPNVPTWAKSPSKPEYSASEVGARPNDWIPSLEQLGIEDLARQSDLTNKVDSTNAYTKVETDAKFSPIEAQITALQSGKADKATTYTKTETHAAIANHHDDTKRDITDGIFQYSSIMCVGSGTFDLDVIGNAISENPDRLSAKRNLTNNVCHTTEYGEWVVHNPLSEYTFTVNQPEFEPDGFDVPADTWVWPATYGAFHRITVFVASGGADSTRLEFYAQMSPQTTFTATRKHVAFSNETFVTYSYVTNEVATATKAKQDALPYPTNAIPYSAITNHPTIPVISATDTTFSNAVLAVELNFATNEVTSAAYIATTNVLAKLGFDADALAELPSGKVYGSVGALLAALAAAVAWMKKKKVDKITVTDTATGTSIEVTADNGVADVADFFSNSNTLLTGTIASETSGKAEKSELPIPIVAKTANFTTESYKRFVVASMPSAGLTLTLHTPTGSNADVFECRFDGGSLSADASVEFSDGGETATTMDTDCGTVKAGKVALMSAFWNGATWDVNWKVEG